MARKPIAAGSFYASGRDELEKQVRRYISVKRDVKIKAGIVPHAGYVYSGKTAGKVFSLIPERKNFIMLGVNHSGYGKKACLSLEDFETPLGIVKNNNQIGKKIFQELGKQGIETEINEKVHQFEHSLEVEIPFLQLSQKASIVPLIFRGLSYEECRKIAKILSEFDDSFILVSSDFTHYGLSYGFVPFSAGKENFERYDKSLVEIILKFDGKSFYEKASRGSICGAFGITILIELARIMGWKARLVYYETSAEVSGDWDNVVGYAGIVFE